MQWEIKWFKFVEKSMPPYFFPRYNKEGKPQKEIFTQSHKKLVKDGGKWLTNTSESCSVVAALIATVAFATSTAITGGTNDEKRKAQIGKPTCIHNTWYHITCGPLFLNSILISFCSGHFFVLKDTLKYAAFPVYALTCLPISFFAAVQFPLYFDRIRATFKSPFGESSRAGKSEEASQLENVPLKFNKKSELGEDLSLVNTAS
ncbi:hypothetical protein TIFTF001_052210 [Ficus carica]|uniref:PGG domain-containing protein n=1 Tax=Ficus carica TaxID=3494 RepID=A0AA88JE93_FICCA|nr:hypothetical protein TIFTF001_052210 [Ficus carica]